MLTSNEIRVQYSGFVIFAAKILSVGTGLIFQLMIARAITPIEYGLWFNINDVLGYFTVLAGTIPFWAMRFVARGREGAAVTGAVANLTISVISTIIYIPLIPVITSALGVGQSYLPLYMLISVQIIELYILNAFESCLRAIRPQTLGYGLLMVETSKVVLGYALIIALKQSLRGAIISLTVALAVQTLYYFWLLSKELSQKVKWSYVKEWIKGSLANLYNAVGNQIAAFIFLMLFTFGGEAARGNYGAAAQIANIITYSSFLAFALYPKLLAEKSSRDITVSLKTVLMFAVPMTAGALALPDSYLTILKSVYRDAWPILVVLALDALVATVSTLFSFVLYGLEDIDEKAKIPLRQLVKSRLFIAFSLPYFHSAITIPTAYYVLTNHAAGQPLLSALSVAIINSAARFIMFIILYIMVRRMVNIEIPWKNIAKYLFASVFMASILYMLPHPTRLLLTLALTAVGGILYLTVLVAVDEEARALVKSIWNEISLKFREGF
ncbi:MAG: polysaccharide biosynthesis C-terminal domain-containing protein [Candidatus Bathyarchaeia archaeon]